MDEADFCFSSLIFTSAVAAVSTLLIISSLSISLLCARVRRNDKGGRESAKDVMHTLRSCLNFCFFLNLYFFYSLQIKQISEIGICPLAASADPLKRFRSLFVRLFPRDSLLKYSYTVIRTVEKRTNLYICRCETSKLPGQKYLEAFQ